MSVKCSSLLLVVIFSAAALAQVPSSISSGTSLEGCLSSTKSGYILNQPALQHSYPLAGDAATLQPEVGKWVRLSGVLEPRHDSPQAAPVMKVTGVQQLRESCGPTTPAPIAEGGKQGNRGDAEPVTSTATVGRPTPPEETQTGRAQEPPREPGAQPNSGSTAYGAPPNWEQVGQERGNDNARSAKVKEAESNGTPNGVKPSTVFGSEDRKGNQGSATLEGCLQQSGTGFVLRETGNGDVIQVIGAREMLRTHVNHVVELAGESLNQAAQAQVAGRSGTGEFRVRAVRDVAPTCGASSKP